MGIRVVGWLIVLLSLTSVATAQTTKSDSSSSSDDTAVLEELACTAGRAYAERDLPTLEHLSADDCVQTDVPGRSVAPR